MRRPPERASPAAELEAGPDVPGERDLGAGLAPHEVGEAARQFALRALRESQEQQLRDGEAEHPVAQELEPLVALASRAGGADMGQGLRRAGRDSVKR